MKYLFAIEIPGKKPTRFEHPDPDDYVKRQAHAVRHAIERVQIAVANPISAAYLQEGSDTPPRDLGYQTYYLRAEFLGASL